MVRAPSENQLPLEIQTMHAAADLLAKFWKLHILNGVSATVLYQLERRFDVFARSLRDKKR